MAHADRPQCGCAGRRCGARRAWTGGCSDSGDTSAASVRADRADIALTASAPASAKAGESRQYTFTIENNGPDAASNVVLTLRAPAGSTVSSLNGAGCSFVGNPVSGIRCTYGSLTGKGSKAARTTTIRFSAHLDTPGAATATGSVTTDTTDPARANNRDSASIAVSRASADAGVRLSGPERALVGDSLEYRAPGRPAGP